MHYCKTQAIYPSTTDEKPLNADILDISPHRVYLVSLQHYLYILSVALVLITPKSVTDGRYPLCFSLVSGLSSLLIAQNDDKAVCGANLHYLFLFYSNRIFCLTTLFQQLNNKLVIFNPQPKILNYEANLSLCHRY
jgi:hypothetical protein